MNTNKVVLNDNEYILFNQLDQYSYGMTKYENDFKVSYAIISVDDYNNLLAKYQS